ncbi:hypothetical protein [Streptomyces sp. 8K308]|uniref:ATP-binding protein n=1 Tax=Streptomyces sp. 8K308 TaxID=2530388 RepID=UPI001FB66CB8|nr:hypothetical protein [Streptomyces sp. 8K308]
MRASAVRLFAARAAAAAPGFVLDEGRAPVVAVICRRLDGLPLALELAATRVRALGLRALAEQLEDRLCLLDTTARGLPARHRTLRAMIAWSWEQLTEPQQGVLRRFAVHPGGCTRQAAEAVCASPGLEPGTVLGLLAQLVDRSLVVPEQSAGGEVRHRLLETVAAYCLEQLGAAGETESVKLLRDAYYVELAERAEPHLYGHQQRRWLEQLDAEAANLRAVLSEAAEPGATPSARRLARRLADALAWYWYLRGRHREARRSLGMVLRLPGAAPSGTAVREAAFAMLTGDGTGPTARGGTLLRELAGKDPRSGWFLALTHLHFGDIETGADLTDLTLAAFRASGDSWGEAAALSGRARQAMFRGDLATAENSGTRSLELFTTLGDQWGQLQATDMLGWLAEVTGDYVRAARLHREGLRTAESLRL